MASIQRLGTRECPVGNGGAPSFVRRVNRFATARLPVGEPSAGSDRLLDRAPQDVTITVMGVRTSEFGSGR